MIEALQILKYLLCGKEIPEDFWDCINVDAEQAELQFIFDVRIPKDVYKRQILLCLYLTTSCKI